LRLLANENIPLASVIALREAGRDVASITQDAPGIVDDAVLRRAHDEHRIILTFDRDYGELLFRRLLPAPDGVLYLRFSPAHPLEVSEYVAELVASGVGMTGFFTTADRERVRQRPL
jgi:hypothetical protein